MIDNDKFEEYLLIYGSFSTHSRSISKHN
ncbi:uncharacterized protein METZ01_LOCUS418646, partial [marine metagenome]